MALGCFSGFWCFQQQPRSSDCAIVPPVPAAATRPNSDSPSSNIEGVRNATTREITRPFSHPSPGNVNIPVPVPIQGSLSSSAAGVTPTPTDARPTGLHFPQGDVDIPALAHTEEVHSTLPSARPAYRLDPAKAKEQIDRISRFHVLITSRMNAGKTTILQSVCNSTDRPEIFNGEGKRVDLTVAQGSLMRGYHNIKDELIFRSNPGFVFHDSCGFEVGSKEQFNMMKKFVLNHAKATELDKRIHAIW
ncbi:hypothetical protein EV401DRAFT_2107892 [Pisolithus croceorrhizus]|nr:hypothetical protein EV401DRAFT_2107892 [Pisolithus croceorrhizus]